MRVSQAIEMLSAINPNEDIAISWWTRDLFTDDNEGTPVSENKWSYAVDVFDSENGYDSVNQDVWNLLWDSIGESNE